MPHPPPSAPTPPPPTPATHGAARPNRRRGVVRRVARAAAWSLCAAVTLVFTAVAGGAWWARSDARLTAGANAALHAFAGPAVTLGRLHWAAPWGLKAEELVVWAPHAAAPALRVHAVQLVLRAPTLAAWQRRTVRVESFGVSGLEAWSGGADGVEAAAQALVAGEREAQGPSPWTVEVAAFGADNVRLVSSPVTDGGAATAAQLPFVVVEGASVRASASLGAGRQQLRDVVFTLARLDVRLPAAADGPATAPPAAARTLSLAPLALDIRAVTAGANAEGPGAASGLKLEGATLHLAGLTLVANAALTPDVAGGERLAAALQLVADADGPWLRGATDADTRARLGLRGGLAAQLHLTAQHAARAGWEAGTGALQLQAMPTAPTSTQLGGVAFAGLEAATAWAPTGRTHTRLALRSGAGALDAAIDAQVDFARRVVGRHQLRVQLAQLRPQVVLDAAGRLGVPGAQKATRSARSHLPTDVAAELRVAGTQLVPNTDVQFSARLAGVGATGLAGRLAPVGVAVSGALAPAGLDVATGELRLGGDVVALQLEGRLPTDDDAPLRGEIALQARGLKELAHALDLPVHARKLALTATLAGSRRAPEAQLQARLVGLAQGGRTLGEVTAALHLADGWLTLERAQLQGAYGSARARGFAELLDAHGALLLDGRVHGELNVGRVALRLYDGATATVRGSVLVGGTVAAPQAALWATATPSVVGAAAATSLPLPQLVMLAEGSPASVQLRALGATYPNGGRATVRGSFRPGDGALFAEVQARGVPLPPLGEVPREAEHELATAQALLPAGGNVDGPRFDAHVVADGSLQHTHLRAQVRALPLHLDLAAQLTDGGRLVAGELQATAALEKLGVWVDGLRPLRPQGEVTLTLRADGPTVAPRLDGVAGMHKLALLGEPVAGGEAQLWLRTPESGVWRATFAPAAWRGVGQAQLEVRRPNGGRGMQAALMVHGLHAAAFWPPLRAMGADLIASLTARGQVGDGPPTLQLTLAQLEARTQGGTLALVKPAHLRLDRKSLQLDPFALRGSAGELTGALRRGRMLDAQLQGRVRLAFVAPFVPALNYASGAIDLDLAAGGEAAHPRPRGTVRVSEPVDVRLRGVPVEVRLAGGEVSLSRRTLRLKDLRGELNGGMFAAGGEVALTSDMRPRRYDVRLQGERLPWHQGPLMLETNVELALQGRGEVPNVVGRIELLSGRVLQKLALRNFKLERREPPPTQSLAERAPWLRKLGLDVQVRSSSGLEVAVDAGTFAVRTSLETDLRLRGNPLAPQLAGKVQAVPSDPGQLRFPRAALQVQQFNVDFEPGRAAADNPLGAEVSLRAEGSMVAAGEREVEHRIAVHLAGAPAALSLELSDSENLSRLGVLSLLTTGHAEFVSAAGGSEVDPLDTAVALASSQLSAPLARFAERKLQQTLNVQLELGAEMRGGQVRVEAAKNVSRRLRVSGAYNHGYSRTAGQASVVTKAQLSLTDRLRLEGQGVHDVAVAQGANADRQQSKLELKLRLFGR